MSVKIDKIFVKTRNSLTLINKHQYTIQDNKRKCTFCSQPLVLVPAFLLGAKNTSRKQYLPTSELNYYEN